MFVSAQTCIQDDNDDDDDEVFRVAAILEMELDWAAKTPLETTET